jgi:hypothetical protein
MKVQTFLHVNVLFLLSSESLCHSTYQLQPHASTIITQVTRNIHDIQTLDVSQQLTSSSGDDTSAQRSQASLCHAIGLGALQSIIDRVPEVAAVTNVWTTPVMRGLLHDEEGICSAARQACAIGISSLMYPPESVVIRYNTGDATDTTPPTRRRTTGTGSSATLVGRYTPLPLMTGAPAALATNTGVSNVLCMRSSDGGRIDQTKNKSTSKKRARLNRSESVSLLGRLRKWSISEALGRKMRSRDGRTDVAKAWGYIVGMLADDLMRPQSRGENAIVHTVVQVAQRLMENSDNDDDCDHATGAMIGSFDLSSLSDGEEWRVSGRRAVLLLGWRYLMENFASRNLGGLVGRHLETFMKPICQFMTPAFAGVVAK